MSYFGTQLDELLNRKQMKAVELSRLSGVDPAMISRYRKGDYVSLSIEELGRLSKAISDDPSEQAQLIRAHLQDQCKGAGSERIRIEIEGTAHVLQESRYQVPLPPKLESAMAVIREWVTKDQNVRELVEGLGNLLKSGDCRTEPLKEQPNISSSAREVQKQAIQEIRQRFPKRAHPPKEDR